MLSVWDSCGGVGTMLELDKLLAVEKVICLQCLVVVEDILDFLCRLNKLASSSILVQFHQYQVNMVEIHRYQVSEVANNFVI